MNRFDVLVVGSGIAGLSTALRLARGATVALVSKSDLTEGSTRYAQGGIAAVTSPDDAIDLHIADTLRAGAGLCDRDAVTVLCSEGPQHVRALIDLGVPFDRDDGQLARGLEAAHSRARVLHAGGDATGAAIEASLVAAVRAHDRITTFERTVLLDLLLDPVGSVDGGRFRRGAVDDGATFDIRASATVLATGGAGRCYRFTTNPEVATGDGLAAAFRAGAVIADAELYQFHPTALALDSHFLVSEAVRGEGAVLRNAKGERFLLDHHPDAELAPRDVVARAIAREMAAQGGAPVLLDATALGRELLAARFPSITAHCDAAGLDWSRAPVPVTPAAHYWMGGVATDLHGRTSLPGLFAVGEVARTGVHGANRLASNSLLEGLVFGARAATAILSGITAEPWQEVLDADLLQRTVDLELPCSQGDQPLSDVRGNRSPGHLDAWRSGLGSSTEERPAADDLRRLLWDFVGLEREAHTLRVAAKQVDVWQALAPLVRPTTLADAELRNLLVVGQLIVDGALRRQESRGAHFRSDYPLSAALALVNGARLSPRSRSVFRHA